MVTRRRGATKLGCLFSVLVVVAATYFAVSIGEVYLRYYRYRDAMHQQGRFGRQATNEAIRRHLQSLADSLGLPEDAGRLSILRGGNRISISAQYDEVVQFPGFVRTLHFAPSYHGPM
jgi:hypothetical protein